MKGLIYKSTGSWYVARTPEGKTYQARIKGIFKIDGINSTNPLAVGDEVEMEPEPDSPQNSIITHIGERRNYIARSSPHHKKQHHIVAANLDQLVLFATLREPRTSQGFLDRYLVAAEMYHVPAVIIFNKADIYRDKEMAQYEELKEMYAGIGYRTVLASMKTGAGVDEVKEVLRDKTTLLSGHSGVGKSTFINAIFPELNLKTREVSGWSGKGMHTTTFAEMFDLPFGGRIIDTPGIREFGLVDLDKKELSHYYPEMRARLQDCQFNNCLHVNEPGCAIKDAVEQREVHIDRYVSYLKILDSL